MSDIDLDAIDEQLSDKNNWNLTKAELSVLGRSLLLEVRNLRAELRKWQTGEIVGIEFVPKMVDALEKERDALRAQLAASSEKYSDDLRKLGEAIWIAPIDVDGGFIEAVCEGIRRLRTENAKLQQSNKLYLEEMQQARLNAGMMRLEKIITDQKDTIILIRDDNKKLRAQLAAAEERERWHKYPEEMPTYYEPVWTWNGDFLAVCLFHGPEPIFKYASSGSEVEGVTHWKKYKPEPPTEAK